MAATRNMREDNITALAIERYGSCHSPRLRKVLTSLVSHLHGFVRDVEPTEAEWLDAIEFLTRVGRTCTDKRQEFILLSDVLGVSMLVDAINHRLPDGATPTTVMGPFHIPDSPVLTRGANMAPGVDGEPVFISGVVRDLDGASIAGASVDVWQPDAAGTYEAQLADHHGPYLRATYVTDADGSFLIRTIAPLGYSIPMDGPVGELVQATEIQPYRPSHIHFDVRAPGCTPLITHLFRAGDPHLDDDVVFAVKDALVVEFVNRSPGTGPNGEVLSSPYYEVAYDFVLQRTNALAGLVSGSGNVEIDPTPAAPHRRSEERE